MEIIVTIIAWTIVLGAVAAAALILTWLARFLPIVKNWRFLNRFCAALALTLCVLGGLCHRPVIWYDAQCKQDLSAEQEAAVLSVSRGVYSKRVPVIPFAVRVSEVTNDYVAWTRIYFPFGTVEMELNGADGYNCTKYLLPW